MGQTATVPPRQRPGEHNEGHTDRQSPGQRPKGAEVISDAYRSYNGLEREYIRGVIDHAEKNVDGRIHTNGIENFWSLLKRAIKGTYVSVEPFHLFRYLDEEAFRFNHRQATEGERFLRLASSVVGKRLTYAELTASTTTPA